MKVETRMLFLGAKIGQTEKRQMRSAIISDLINN